MVGRITPHTFFSPTTTQYLKTRQTTFKIPNIVRNLSQPMPRSTQTFSARLRTSHNLKWTPKVIFWINAFLLMNSKIWTKQEWASGSTNLTQVWTYCQIKLRSLKTKAKIWWLSLQGMMGCRLWLSMSKCCHQSSITKVSKVMLTAIVSKWQALVISQRAKPLVWVSQGSLRTLYLELCTKMSIE